MMTASKGVTAGAGGARPEPAELVQEVLYETPKAFLSEVAQDEHRRGSLRTGLSAAKGAGK